jgi:hypothetical protein
MTFYLPTTFLSLISFVKELLPLSKDKKNKQENKVVARPATRLT